MDFICSHKNRVVETKFNKITIWSCPNCKLIFRDIDKIDDNPEKIYSSYYKPSGARFGYLIEVLVRAFRFWRALRLQYYVGNKIRSIIDVGCGRGYTLWFLKKFFKVKTVIGIQPSVPAADFAKKILGIPIVRGDVLVVDLPDKKFQVVTLWHVLEHISEPEKVIARLRSIIEKEGYIIIETPNFASWTSVLTGQDWLGLDLQHHINFFTFQSLNAMLIRCGFMINKASSFSIEYSTFVSAESLATKITGQQHRLFNWLRGIKVGRLALINLALTLLFFIPCFIINILLIYSGRGEVVFIVARKNS